MRPMLLPLLLGVLGLTVVVATGDALPRTIAPVAAGSASTDRPGLLATPEPGTPLPRLVPLHRLVQSETGDHFYTADAAERAAVVDLGYRDEGPLGDVFDAPAPGTIPLHRLRHEATGRHLYTVAADVREIALVSGLYLDEGAAGYVFGAEVAGTRPLYALYALDRGDRLYTTDPAERDAAVAAGYQAEGVACYLADAQAIGTVEPGPGARAPAPAAVLRPNG